MSRVGVAFDEQDLLCGRIAAARLTLFLEFSWREHLHELDPLTFD